MNRIFHARITIYQYLLLLLLGGNAVALLWYKYSIAAVLIVLMLIVLIEQIIHTTYTITKDNHLILSKGRFSAKIDIDIKQITKIGKGHSMKFGRFSLTDYVLIEYGNGRYASAIPVKEIEFIDVIERRMYEIAHPQNDNDFED